MGYGIFFSHLHRETIKKETHTESRFVVGRARRNIFGVWTFEIAIIFLFEALTRVKCAFILLCFCFSVWFDTFHCCCGCCDSKLRYFRSSVKRKQIRVWHSICYQSWKKKFLVFSFFFFLYRDASHRRHFQHFYSQIIRQGAIPNQYIISFYEGTVELKIPIYCRIST